jgi:hypothetical protein
VSMINFGGGLAAMGQSIAETAGQAGLTQQKADLEMQKETLASQLAEGRESRLETQRAGHQQDLAKTESGLRTGEYKAQKDIDLQQLPAVALATQDILKMQASDPAYVKAIRTMTDAKASVQERAAANLYSVQAIGAKIENKAKSQLVDARQELEDATSSGDQARIAAAQKSMYIAQYSMHDEVQRAAALTAQESNDRLQVQSLQAEITAKSVGPLGEQPEQKAAREGLIRQLQANLAVAQDNYDSTRAMAQKAASQIPSFSMGNPSGGDSLINKGSPKPPLSEFWRTNPGATAVPVTP